MTLVNTGLRYGLRYNDRKGIVGTILKKSLLIFLCLIATVTVWPYHASCAGLALNIDGPASVKAYEEFTVALTVDGDNLAGLSGTIVLDDNLKLVDHTSLLNAPWQIEVRVEDQILHFVLTDPSAELSINAQTDILTLTLLARSVGEARIVVDELMGTDANGSFAVSPAAYRATVEKSQNTQLASLSADRGTLSPLFSASIYSYTLTVPYDTAQVSLFATTQDQNSIISGAGAVEFVSQQRAVDIVITAQDSSTSTVAVTIVRAPQSTQSFTQMPDATASEDTSRRSGALVGIVFLFAGCVVGISLIVLGLMRQRKKR